MDVYTAEDVELNEKGSSANYGKLKAENVSSADYGKLKTGEVSAGSRLRRWALFLAIGMAIALFIWVPIYVHRHKGLFGLIKDGDRAIELSFIANAIYQAETDSTGNHGVFRPYNFSVSCGRGAPCADPLKLEVLHIPDSMVLVRFPREIYTCKPCPSPVLVSDYPLSTEFIPRWEQRFEVAIHDSDIVTTYKGWLDISDKGYITIRPQAYDIFPGKDETVRFLGLRPIGWFVGRDSPL